MVKTSLTKLIVHGQYGAATSQFKLTSRGLGGHPGGFLGTIVGQRGELTSKDDDWSRPEGRRWPGSKVGSLGAQFVPPTVLGPTAHHQAPHGQNSGCLDH